MARGDRVASFRLAVARLLQLPEDLVLNLPRLTMIGDLQLLVENHQGIIAFTGQRVVIRTTSGPLAVTGRGLLVGAVDREAVILTGTIRGVQFEGDR